MSNERNKLEAQLCILKRHRDQVDAYIFACENWLKLVGDGIENNAPPVRTTLQVNTFEFFPTWTYAQELEKMNEINELVG